MTIRTLHITNHYHETSGGIRTILHAMLQSADCMEMPLTLLVPSSEDKVERIGKFGRIYHVKAPNSPCIDRRYRLITPGRIYPPKSAVWRILNAEKPDLIAITDKYMMPYMGGLIRKSWAPLAYRPTLAGISCERMDDNVRTHLPSFPWQSKFVSWYLGSIYIPQFDAHIANSFYTAGELLDAMTPKHWRPVEVATPGVDSDTFYPGCRSEETRAQLRNRWAIPQSARLLVYSGRLSPEKNPMLLLETLDRLLRRNAGDFRILIVGDGPLRQFMEKESKSNLRGKVCFMDHLADRGHLAATIASCDAYIHPNPHEPFGIAPLEAMACQLPVILPNQGGVMTYANRSNSWPASPNPEDFAQAVCDVFNYPEERRQRTIAARITAMEFSWNKVLVKLFACFERLHAQRLNLHSQPVNPSACVNLSGCKEEFSQ